jgi:hypothetical protein
MELVVMPCTRNAIFTMIVDALFTTFEKWPFTKGFDRVTKMQAVLACGVRASRINSPAT